MKTRTKMKNIGKFKYAGFNIDIAHRMPDNDYIAIVTGMFKGRMTICSTGMESDKESAITWAMSAIDLKAWETGGNCPPDLYDRRTVN